MGRGECVLDGTARYWAGWMGMGQVRPHTHHLPTTYGGRTFHIHTDPLPTKIIPICAPTRADAIQNSYNFTHLSSLLIILV